MKKIGNVIIFDLAQRENDRIKVGKDLLNHMVNLTQIGADERRRALKTKPGQDENEHLHLMDKFVALLLQNAEEVSVKINDAGWGQLIELTKQLEQLNKKLMR